MNTAGDPGIVAHVLQPPTALVHVHQHPAVVPQIPGGRGYRPAVPAQGGEDRRVKGLGGRDSGTARASSEREPAGHPADQDGLVLNLGAGHRIDPEAAEQRYGVQRGDLRP